MSDTDPAPAAGPPAEIICETAVRRLWDYLDGGLDATPRAEVAGHLATCERCPPHFAFSARTLDALAAVHPAADPDDAELRDRVLAALHGA